MSPQIQAIPTPFMWVARRKVQFTEFVGISAVPISDGSGLVFVYRTPTPENLSISAKAISFASFSQTVPTIATPESLGVAARAIANASAFLWINPTTPPAAESFGISAAVAASASAFVLFNEASTDSLGISAKPISFASS